MLHAFFYFLAIEQGIFQKKNTVICLLMHTYAQT